MRYIRFIPLALCLFVAAPPTLHADEISWESRQTEKVENPPQTVRLEYRFSVNDLSKYRITVAGDGQVKLPGQTEQASLQTHSKMTFARRVTASAAESGTWHVQWELIKGNLSIPEFDPMPVNLPRIELDMDKYGAVRSLKGPEKLANTPGLPPGKTMGDILTQLKSPGFPQKDLRVGDKWEQTYSVQIPGQKAVPVKATSELVGFERVLKTDCARIKTTYEAPFAFVQDEAGSVPGGGGTGAISLVGKEAGEFWTCFAYKEGKVIMSHGSIRLMADARSDTPEDSAPPPEKAAAPAPDAEPGAAAAIAAPPAEIPTLADSKHDLNVKFDVVSELLPQEPTEAEKGKNE